MIRYVYERRLRDYQTRGDTMETKKLALRIRLADLMLTGTGYGTYKHTKAWGVKRGPRVKKEKHGILSKT